jgi:putative transposase
MAPACDLIDGLAAEYVIADKERNRVERFFSRIKQCRRIATRYDKLAETFMGFVILASIMLWLR